MWPRPHGGHGQRPGAGAPLGGRAGHPHFFDVGAGVCHQVMIEEGLVAARPDRPGHRFARHLLWRGRRLWHRRGLARHGPDPGQRAQLAARAGDDPRQRARALPPRRQPQGPEPVPVRAAGHWMAPPIRPSSSMACDWLDLDGRETLARMTTELGAKAGMIPPTGEVVGASRRARLAGRVRAEAPLCRAPSTSTWTHSSPRSPIPPEVDHVVAGRASWATSGRPGLHRHLHQRPSERPARRRRHPARASTSPRACACWSFPPRTASCRTRWPMARWRRCWRPAPRSARPAAAPASAGTWA